MRVLIIGQGAREHALVRALHNSPSVTGVHAIPGNDGMRSMAICHPHIDWKDMPSLIQFCLHSEIQFVVVGPEEPLVNGIADALRDRGILVVGPEKSAANLEGSKIFSKNFMQANEIPTARFFVVSSTQETLLRAEQFTPPYVLKADGLCGGKGVAICKDLDELKHTAELFFDREIFGPAGTRALLEEHLSGWEMSLTFLTNGKDYRLLPIAMDHKRLKDNNQGPNTGGMGAIAPMPVDSKLLQAIERQCIRPTLNGIESSGMIYRGIVFMGLIITNDGPRVLEYNVRLGDPETEVLLPLLDVDVGQLLFSLAEGKLINVPTRNLFSCCVILAAEGYPELPVKGATIEGDLNFETPSSYFLHAGTKALTKTEAKSTWVTNGGRVLASVGIGDSINSARKNAYEQARHANWKGLQLREDIGLHLPKQTT